MTTTINPNQLVRKFQNSRKRKAEDSLANQSKRKSPNKKAPTTTHQFSTQLPSNFSFAPIHTTTPPQTLAPLDWGVKEHVRVTSRNPITWATSMSSKQVSAGTNSFVSGDISTSQDIKSQFRESLLAWIHPALPYVVTKQNSSLPDNLIEEMKQDWQTALSSAYQHLTAKQCNYFYLLSTNLAILFTSATASSPANALITGASDKLETALKQEEVQLQEKQPTADTTADEEAGDWLEGFGISSKDISLLPKKGTHINTSVLNTKDIHGLVNFLINYDPLFSNGIPTLLSPNLFEGATLRAARYTSGTSEEDGEKMRFVDISGPMLPSNILRLHELLKKEHNEYSLKMRNQSVTDKLVHAMRLDCTELIGEEISLQAQIVKSVVYRHSMYHM
ncbi:Protein downstream neighbor of son-like [Oopsacas minuta]|uniref:Protein downstream neighbor of son-like n=1 Tax=Oopsacas minuta TaxID=111878 RepID=A0AAV7JAW1_9METZ|nr:Protein downstream neighbor of son-like [Oopsacas minuta]